jgi:hypothetical protein
MLFITSGGMEIRGADMRVSVGFWLVLSLLLIGALTACKYSFQPDLRSYFAFEISYTLTYLLNLNCSDVFGVGTNNHCYHRWWDGSSWGGWEDRGGILESEVITTKWGTNDLSIFGIGTNSAMYWQHWNGASWSGWISLGGIFTSVPAAVSWGAGRIDVFGIGSDGAMYHKYYNGAWSGTWENLGGIFISAPTVVSVSHPPALTFMRTKVAEFFSGATTALTSLVLAQIARLTTSRGMAPSGLQDGPGSGEVLPSA